MNPAKDREESLFQEALHRPAGPERAAFLEQACSGNQPLLRRLEALLQEHENPDSFLEPEPVAGAKGTVRLDFAEEAPTGTRIGRYKLLQKIGEGGMGVVYMAEQEEPVRRKVALKIIKLGMDTRQVVARFEAERQALAMMDHPNIASVLDGGATEAGRPYFVMELVQGVPITEFCDQNKLPAHERLNLFIQICQAIQSAHQKGVVHRDIKPSNVLVTLNHGQPTPKVIDFGVAKATNQKLTEKTLFTGYGAMIGTPAYMSPEQAEMSSLDVDTRADVYSLGVLLYELLTGSTPFPEKRLRSLGYAEIQRVIMEEEPERPSTRLSTMSQEEKRAVTMNRGQEFASLSHLLKGDLDWIVMKCLEKDRRRRYETANGLAADIQRHLSNEPVVARPPSMLYRLQKMFSRNRLFFAASGVVAMALIAGLGLSTWSFLREREAHADARRSLYVADLNLAQQAWDQNNIGQIRQLLEETRTFPDRGFESYHWQKQAHLYLRALRGHGNAVNSVSFSADGRRIVTGSADSTAKLWDAFGGRELLTLRGHREAVSSVAFSPDSRQLVTGSWDKTAKVWDTGNGREVLTLNGHTGWILAVAFSPDGQRIVTSSTDYTVRVWERTSGRQLLVIKGPVIRAVAFSPDSHRIVTGGDDYNAKVYDAASGQELLRLKGHALHISSVVFSPDGQRIVTGSWDHTAKVWDAASGQELLTLKGHRGRIYSVAYGRRIVTGSDDHTAKVWDAASGQELFTLKGHDGWINSVAVSSDDQRIATGSADHTACVWDASDDLEPLTLRDQGSGIFSAAFSPNGRRIVTGGSGQVKVWDAASGREWLTLHGHGGVISSTAFSPDGQRILTAGWDNTAIVWDAVSGRELLTLNLAGTNIQVRSIAFSPDGRRIVTGCGDVTARLWDATNGRELLRFGENVIAVAFSPDGRRIVTGGWDAKARLFDAANGRELLTLPLLGSPSQWLWEAATGRGFAALKGHSSWIESVAFSPDGQRLVTGGLDSLVKVWDAVSGRLLLTLQGHNDAVSSVAFSPDGRRIVTGSADHTSKVWDSATGRELLTLTGHNDAVSAVAFSPDGERILTASPDGTAKVWATAGKEQVRDWQAEETDSSKQNF